MELTLCYLGWFIIIIIIILAWFGLGWGNKVLFCTGTLHIGQEILYLVIKKYVSFWEILVYFNLLGNLSHTFQWSLFPFMKVDPYKNTFFFLAE